VDNEMQNRILSVSASDDGFLVVWSAFNMGDARRNIYARRIPLTGEATESVRITDDVWTNDSPSVAHAGGSNLVAWYDNSECETAGETGRCDYEIQVSQTNRDGLPIGDRINLTSNTLRDDQPALLAYEGGVLAVWVQDDDDSRLARSQLLTSTGVPRGTSAVITTHMNSLTTPVLARLGEGFAMAWAEPRAEARRMVVMPLDDLGRAAGPIEPINTEDNADGYVDLASTSLEMAAVFGVQIDGIRDDVRFRRITLEGRPVGLEQSIARAPLRGRDPSIAPFHGGYIIAYRLLEGSPEGDGSFIRIVTTDIDGMIGEELDLIECEETGGRTSVSVAPDGTVLVVWPDIQEFVGTTLSGIRIRCED